MYSCPNCASALKFNISMQKLYCEHCDTTLDPYELPDTQVTEDKDLYQVTAFCCPGCGGELLTEDTTVATFCSYCDSPTILDSRIYNEKRPDFIIPFQKTKEDCKQSYQKMMKRAFFAPNALKDVESIDKFRGIYMPYWLYDFKISGNSTFQGVKLENGKDCYYDITSQVNAEYINFTYDASSSFYDGLSAAVAPFDMSQQKDFHPAYLSGFYADSSDVPSEFYQSEVESIVMNDISNQFKTQYSYEDYDIEHMDLNNTFSPKKNTHLALLPVWFLSYRNGDRVAYAVVNGQTGEAAADLPIDKKKYIVSSLVMTVPIFILLNLFFTLTPSLFLMLCVAISSIFTIVANNMTTNILLQESCSDMKLSTALRKEDKRKKDSVKLFLGGAFAICLEFPPILVFIGYFFVQKYFFILFLIAMILFIAYMFRELSAVQSAKEECIDTMAYHENWKKKLHIMLKPLAAILLASIIIAINPVSDIIFYFTGLICMSILLWCVWDIIYCHNMLCTHKLPQLNKRGGDHLE